MSNRQLTPISYVVLGLVADGAATSYDMKQKASHLVGYFWNFPHSQLYAEPARLVELGLLEEEREPEGRRRRVYTLTGAGRKALDEWLREPTTEQPQIRDAGLLKLFFGGGLSTAEVTELAQTQERFHRARLAVYKGVDTEGMNPKHAAVVRAGVLHERTFADFWREVAATPP